MREQNKYTKIVSYTTKMKRTGANECEWETSAVESTKYIGGSKGNGETHVAGKVRAATIAVVNVAGRGVVESSVEVVARTLSVELTRAVGNVGLGSGQTKVESLEELEHLVKVHKPACPAEPQKLNQSLSARSAQRAASQAAIDAERVKTHDEKAAGVRPHDITSV